MEHLAGKLFFDLKAMGVNLANIVITQVDEAIHIDFPWQYYGSKAMKKRSITLITADITQPENYPMLLKRKLAEQIDIFYMKAAFTSPLFYDQFLPEIAKSLKKGGWLMTTDKTFQMETVNPEICLKQNDLRFQNETCEEKRRLEEMIYPPSDPLLQIASLQVHPPSERIVRNIGSDLSYWAMLTLRKKL